MDTVKTVKGVIITLTQGAYLTGTRDNPYYQAHGIDEDNIEYDVVWVPVPGWEAMEDESDRCKWDSPDIITYAGEKYPNLAPNAK